MFEGWMNWSCVCPQIRGKILLLCLIIQHLYNNINYSLYLFRILNIMKLLLLRLGSYCNRHHLLALRRFSSAPKICIVGSGPASFYTAQHLIKVWDIVRTLMREALDCTLIFYQTKELPYEHLFCILTEFEKKSLPDVFSIICMAWLVCLLCNLNELTCTVAMAVSAVGIVISLLYNSEHRSYYIAGTVIWSPVFVCTVIHRNYERFSVSLCTEKGERVLNDIERKQIMFHFVSFRQFHMSKLIFMNNCLSHLVLYGLEWHQITLRSRMW